MTVLTALALSGALGLGATVVWLWAENRDLRDELEAERARLDTILADAAQLHRDRALMADAERLRSEVRQANAAALRARIGEAHAAGRVADLQALMRGETTVQLPVLDAEAVIR